MTKHVPRITIVLMFLLININSFSRPKNYYAITTCNSPCPPCSRVVPEQSTDPCLKTYYCTDAQGKHHAMGCTSHTWDAANPGGTNDDAEAMDAFALWYNTNIYVSSEENDEGVFTACLKEDYSTTVEAASFNIPAEWNETGWGFKIYYISGSNNLLIKVFPHVWVTDSLFLDQQNEDGGLYAYVSVASMESQLGLLNKRTTDLTEIFSSDDIKTSIYPNPTHTDVVFVELKVPSNGKYLDHTVKIYDIGGRLVIKNDFEELVNSVSIKNLRSGIYIVEVIDMKGLILKKEKLIVKKNN